MLKRKVFFFAISTAVIIAAVAIIVLAINNEGNYHIRTRAELSRVFGVDFSEFEILDIKTRGNSIYVISNKLGESHQLADDEYVYDFESYPYPTSEILETIGLSEANVQRFGYLEGLYLAKGDYVTMGIRLVVWYQLDENHNLEGNLLFVTPLLGSNTRISARSIMNEQD